MEKTSVPGVWGKAPFWGFRDLGILIYNLGGGGACGLVVVLGTFFSFGLYGMVAR